MRAGGREGEAYLVLAWHKGDFGGDGDVATLLFLFV